MRRAQSCEERWCIVHDVLIYPVSQQSENASFLNEITAHNPPIYESITYGEPLQMKPDSPCAASILCVPDSETWDLDTWPVVDLAIYICIGLPGGCSPPTHATSLHGLITISDNTYPAMAQDCTALRRVYIIDTDDQYWRFSPS